MLATAGDKTIRCDATPMCSSRLVHEFAAEICASIMALALGVMVSILICAKVQKLEGGALLPVSGHAVQVSQHEPQAGQGSVEASSRARRALL